MYAIRSYYEADGDDEDDARGDVLDRGGVAQEAEAVRQRLHHQRPEDRARHGPDAARERGAADDRCGDDQQLISYNFV